MFELFKIVWDLVVLRDAARRGQLNWRIWPMAFGFVLFLYGTGIPAVLLYEKHPQYEPLLIAAVIFDGILFICFMGWAWRWHSGRAACRTLELVEVLFCSRVRCAGVHHRHWARLLHSRRPQSLLLGGLHRILDRCRPQLHLDDPCHAPLEGARPPHQSFFEMKRTRQEILHSPIAAKTAGVGTSGFAAGCRWRSW